MNDVWDVVRKSKRQEILERKLSTGVYCFTILGIKSSKPVVNKYDRIYDKNKDNYLDKIKKNKDYVGRYDVCNVDLRVKYWTCKQVIDKMIDFKDKLVKTQITLPILQLMREQLDVFINHSLPVPELVIYWKQNQITVKYTFLYEKDYDKYKEYIESNNYAVLKNEFYWLGRKEYFDEIKMLEWYKNG